MRLYSSSLSTFFFLLEMLYDNKKFEDHRYRPQKNQQTLYPYSGPNAAKQDEEIYLLGTNSVPTVRMNSLL